MGYGPHQAAQYSHPFEPADEPGTLTEEQLGRAAQCAHLFRRADANMLRAQAAEKERDLWKTRAELAGYTRDSQAQMWERREAHALMRAEKAEAECAQWQEWYACVEARAVAAEADAALAWQRVTELQERGTELVLQRRAVEAQLAEAERLWADDRERARKMTAAAVLECRRTGEAVAKLGELVREVHEWSPRYSDHVEPERWREFDAILDKYEAAP
jgi:hypothetical protein